MFHEEHSNPEEAAVKAASSILGHQLPNDKLDLLRSYVDWLAEEAIPAGGLGPREGARIWDRHIADSLGFARGFLSQPDEMLDVGTGVGLPGIPLAILWPETFITLLDRGGRRIRLLYRVVRRLGLPNVRVAQGDVFAVADEWQSLVFRGAVPPMEAVGLSARLLDVPGTAVLGLSRQAEYPANSRDLTSMAQALGMQSEVVDAGSILFDAPSWLLIMRTNGALPA